MVRKVKFANVGLNMAAAAPLPRIIDDSSYSVDIHNEFEDPLRRFYRVPDTEYVISEYLCEKVQETHECNLLIGRKEQDKITVPYTFKFVEKCFNGSAAIVATFSKWMSDLRIGNEMFSRDGVPVRVLEGKFHGVVIGKPTEFMDERMLRDRYKTQYGFELNTTLRWDFVQLYTSYQFDEIVEILVASNEATKRRQWERIRVRRPAGCMLEDVVFYQQGDKFHESFTD